MNIDRLIRITTMLTLIVIAVRLWTVHPEKAQPSPTPTQYEYATWTIRDDGFSTGSQRITAMKGWDVLQYIPGRDGATYLVRRSAK